MGQDELCIVGRPFSLRPMRREVMLCCLTPAAYLPRELDGSAAMGQPPFSRPVDMTCCVFLVAVATSAETKGARSAKSTYFLFWCGPSDSPLRSALKKTLSSGTVSRLVEAARVTNFPELSPYLFSISASSSLSVKPLVPPTPPAWHVSTMSQVFPAVPVSLRKMSHHEMLV